MTRADPFTSNAIDRDPIKAVVAAVDRERAAALAETAAEVAAIVWRDPPPSCPDCVLHAR